MKKKSIRDAIVSTSIRLFYKQGYSNTGINQIIDEARIAKASLYQHFRSKEELLIVYLEVTGKQTIEALTEAAEKYQTPREKVLGIFDFLESLVDQNEFYGCHFLNMVYELPEDALKIRDIVKMQKNNVRALFGEILAPLDRPGLEDEVYTLFEGALIANKVHNSPWPIITAKSILNKII
jgi:AcrR family transcriptional regulator